MASSSQLIRDAKLRGRHPSTISQGEWLAESLARRTPTQIVKDGAKALGSRVKTDLLKDTVPEDKYQRNIRICETNSCGSFILIKGKTPVCLRCDCAGKFLESKARNKKESCPLQLWSNTNGN